MNLYGMIGGIVLLLATAATALYFRGEMIEARANEAALAVKYDTVVAANKTANDTIAAMQEQERFNGQLTSSLIEQMRAVNQNVKAQNEALARLEQVNEAVHAYLNAVVPDDLRKLYEH